MKFLIVGGAGLIGNYLSDALYNDGFEVMIIDNFSSSKKIQEERQEIYKFCMQRRNKNIVFKDIDVRNEEILEEAIKSYKPDVIYYLPALLASESRENPQVAHDVIVNGLKKTIEILEGMGRKYKLVMASSSYVYGNFVKAVADELHPLAPIDVYGTCKLEAEKYLDEFNWKFGDWVILRPSSVYGIGDPRSRYASRTIEEAVQKGKVTVYYPDFICDFSYVKDVAQAFKLAGIRENISRSILNVTYGEAHTNLSFVKKIKEFIPELEFVIDTETAKGAPVRGALDSSKARRLLEWEPQFPIEKGIKDSIQLIKEMINKE